MNWIDRLHDPQKKNWVRLISAFLLLISWIYGLMMQIRNLLYDKGWIKAYRSSAYVVSVGNIVAGGVGKTPLTLKIAKLLQERVENIALLSRGYLSDFEHKKIPTLISQGSGPCYLPQECGDEPYLISQNVPKAHFYVGKNRVLSAKMAEKVKAKVLLLDDAMQYRKLHRDIEIVVLNAEDPFGKGYFLPRGFLREPLKALKRADLMVINHVQDKKKIGPLLQKLELITKAPYILTRVKTQGFFDLEDQIIDSLKGIQVGAFCGLAKPENFFKTLQEEGLDLVSKKSLKDHRHMSLQELQNFSDQSKDRGARYLLCSEKDRVKISKNIQLSLPIIFLKIELEIVEGKEDFEKILEKCALSESLKTSN
jgi:tetraacyldisaccharide 4'-kinase